MYMKEQKFLSVLLAVVMVLALLPVNMAYAIGAELQYIDENGQTKTVTDSYTRLESSDGTVTVDGVTYVEGNVIVKELCFAQSDNAMLILGNGSKLTVTGALKFQGELTITVVPGATASELVVDTTEDVGIFGRNKEQCKLNVYGGSVKSTASRYGSYIDGGIKTTGNASFVSKSRGYEMPDDGRADGFGICTSGVTAMDSSTIKGEVDDVTTSKHAMVGGIFMMGFSDTTILVSDNAAVIGVSGDVSADGYYSDSYGICCTVGEKFNISGNGKFEGYGGNSTVTGDSGTSYGIYILGYVYRSETVSDNATVIGVGGDVSSCGNYASSYGIYCTCNSDFNVSDNAKAEGYGGDATAMKGSSTSVGMVFDGKMNIDGGSVTAVGGYAGGGRSKSYSYGFQINMHPGRLNLNNAKMTAYGDANADNYYDIYVNNSQVDAGINTRIYGKDEGAVRIKAKTFTIGDDSCVYNCDVKFAAGTEINNSEAESTVEVLSSDGRDVMVLLEDGCAFKNMDGDVVSAAMSDLAYANICVVEHVCDYDTQGRCKCGRNCDHTINPSTGVCSICGLQKSIGVTKSTQDEVYWAENMDDALEKVKNSTESDDALITLYGFAQLRGETLPAGTYTIDINGKSLNPGRGLSIEEGTNVTLINSYKLRGNMVGPSCEINGGNLVVDNVIIAGMTKLTSGSVCVKNDGRFSDYFEVSGGNLVVYDGSFGSGITVKDEGKTYKDYVVGFRTIFDRGNAEPIPYSEWSVFTQRGSMEVRECKHSFDESDYCKYCNAVCDHKNGDGSAVGNDGKCTKCGYQYYGAKVSVNDETTFYATVSEAAEVMDEGKTFTLLTDAEFSDDMELNGGTYYFGTYKLTVVNGKKIVINEGESVTVKGVTRYDEIVGGMGNNIQVNGKLTVDNISLGDKVKVGANGVLCGTGTIGELDASALINGYVRLSEGCKAEKLIIPPNRSCLDFINDGYAFYQFESGSEDYTLLISGAENTEVEKVKVKAHTCEFNTDCICSCGREATMPAVSYLNEYNDEVWATRYKLVQNSDSDVQWGDGFYVIKGDVKIDGKIITEKKADIRLILCDDSTLTVKGITAEKKEVNDYMQTFTIYAQSKDSNRGKLISTGFTDGDTNCGIYAFGNLAINGGDVTATTESLKPDGILKSYGVRVGDSLRVCNGAKLTATGGNVNAKLGKNASYMDYLTSSGIWLGRKFEIKDAVVNATGGTATLIGDGAEKLPVSSVGIYTSTVNIGGNSVINATAKDSSLTKIDVQNTTHGDYSRSIAVYTGNKAEISGGEVNLTCGKAAATGSQDAIKEELELSTVDMDYRGGKLNLTKARMTEVNFSKGTTLRDILADDTYGLLASDGWHNCESIAKSFSDAEIKRLPITELSVAADKEKYIVDDTITLTATITLAENIKDEDITYKWYKIEDGSENEIIGETGKSLKITNADAGSYTYKCIAEADEYKTSNTAMLTVNVGDVTDVSVTQTNTLIYNKQPRTATVSATATTVNDAEVTFVYSAEKDGTYTSDIPSFIDAGEYTVYYKASAPMHGGADGNFTVVIDKATPTEKEVSKTTAKVRKGKALSTATITKGEFLSVDGITAIDGTFAWVDGDKLIKSNSTEQIVFTPTDTNYDSVTIDVAVSVHSSSEQGGGNGGGSSFGHSSSGGGSIAPTTPTTPTESEWVNPFIDVKVTDWFFDSVKYANQNDLMNGTTSNTFSPEAVLTRGMLVTVLYRAEGEPSTDGENRFTDVDGDMYYANAISWAQQTGIVNGVSEIEFVPEENVTREQIAAIIFRYGDYKGIVSIAGLVEVGYADTEEISDYAMDGVMYCTAQGIMQGKENNVFAPQDFATRAEVAAILQRFIER